MAMTLRLSAEQDAALSSLAAVDGISKQDAAVRAILETSARRAHETRVKEISAAALTRYGDLLDRLGR